MVSVLMRVAMSDWCASRNVVSVSLTRVKRIFAPLYIASNRE
jgi:hypothetical protein